MDDILASPGKINAATTGPGGLPQEVVDYLTEHFDTVMQNPEIDEIQQNLGTFPLLASSIMVLSSLIMMGEMRYLSPTFNEGEKENREKAIWNILFPDRMASVVVLVVIYAVLLPHVGFTIATAGRDSRPKCRLGAGSVPAAPRAIPASSAWNAAVRSRRMTGSGPAPISKNSNGARDE